ncbi:hypothetical protein RRG08_004970 [Elysia crispata]|uniref:Uncharacterized protein n=1 Tax=Elysia crispata TaxID=231223 RepID=A0AAE0ZJ56_9GAST|nr:hypothetical protein RRG08_004970 [Elysia crispata]
MKGERFSTLPSVLAEYGHVPEKERSKTESFADGEDEENIDLSKEKQEKSFKKKFQKQPKASQSHTRSRHERMSAKRAWSRKGSEAEGDIVLVNKCMHTGQKQEEKD